MYDVGACTQIAESIGSGPKGRFTKGSNGGDRTQLLQALNVAPNGRHYLNALRTTNPEENLRNPPGFTKRFTMLFLRVGLQTLKDRLQRRFLIWKFKAPSYRLGCL